MSETFTIEQIEAAMIRVNHDFADDGPINDYQGKVIAELTRTQWKPEINDLVHYETSTQAGYCLYAKGWMDINCNLRAITPDEVPAWKRDKEALKVAIMSFGRLTCTFEDDGDRVDYAERSLAKIKELTGEDME